MPVWGWVLIAAIVVIALVVVATVFGRSALQRRKTQRLKDHFGPEYERTVREAGEQQAAEAELTARERDRKKLDIVPLSARAGQMYAERWRMVQAAFVDNPPSAVGEAERLVTEVMRERGYPVDDFDQRAADISVDHPDVVENYRGAHGIYLAQQERDIDTEEQRRAFVHYRALFEKMIQPDPDKKKNTSEEARA